ncbi:Tryptophan synthase alpha chain [Labilithrix luteola]|uniref:Tryptophan synthase alpha chain n=1 Tax=Labilithrix luteola TaxID=1391654 RepID=A0A0K1QF66_9BACT|nr:hypothetical protein [Labilithrix luteola]AKV04404.1 Tryptophan synthase alpha chain [Labilithrix luteola]
MNSRDVRAQWRAHAFAGSALVLLVISCGERQNVSLEDSPPHDTFVTPDAGDGDGGGDAPSSETRMCAVTTCTLPWATCPSSEFPCSTNLLNDDDNCGACGVRCGGVEVDTKSKWTCVDGQCAFGCYGTGWHDCDNDGSNGCETDTLGDSANCGQCGHQCPDGLVCDGGTCINPCMWGGFPDSCDGLCTDLRTDDQNCGACGNACDPTGPGKPELHGSMHYGCVDGQCGRPKCNEELGRDCNGNPADGCEVEIHTNDNCGGCGDQCSAGKECGLDSFYRCLCDDGETYCGGGYMPCRRLDDDPQNCGGCNNLCPGSSLPHFEPTCSFGTCSGKCLDGYADCDGLRENGCEVNARIDNRNCGGCGQACAIGQVCSEGKCLVAPCETEGPTAK